MSKNFLRQIRQEKSYGQSELARMAGVSKQLLCGFENGRNGLSHEVLRKLSDILQVSPTYLAKGSDNDANSATDKTRMLEAMRVTSEYYKDYEFDSEMMSNIAAEMYQVMSNFEKLKDQMDSNRFNKLLNEKVAAGLAAKCFLSFNKKNEDD